MNRIKVLNFDPLSEKWRQCHLDSLYYPETMLIEAEDGKYYCHVHYNFRWKKKYHDDARIDIKDDLE